MILGSINLFNYLETNNRSNAILNLLAENDGEFPNMFFHENGQIPGDFYVGITAETQFEARYFTAKIFNNDDKLYLNLQKIATITAEEANNYVKKASQKNRSFGRINGFKYAVVETDDACLYVFLDCTKEFRSTSLFLLLSVFIGVFGLIGVFLLILVFSKFALSPVEESYKKQKAFITNASHDIKTPLAVINAEVDLLRMDYGKNESTEEIKIQTEKLSNLTDKLILLSKMEEAETHPFCKINLSEILQNSLSTYKKVFEAEGFDFSSDVRDDIYINANEELLQRALSLILDNALKYTDKRGKIFVSLKKTDKVQILFKNDAKEVSSGEHPEFFERFYRGDLSRNGEKEGNGIGLSVVKAIIETHKGKISAYADNGMVSLTITL